MSDEKPVDAQPAVSEVYERAADFLERYANNVRFESTVWDLRLILGIVDQSTAPSKIRQHGSLNVPWPQAKLMAYYLMVNVAYHEFVVGNIPVPDHVMPPSIDTFWESSKDDPQVQALLARINTVRAVLFR